VTNVNGLASLGANRPFAEYAGWKGDRRGAKIVTVGLFKGGVGKTHLAMNFACYVSETKRLPVLLIDVDFQGSMSAAILNSAGIVGVGSRVDELFSEDANQATLTRQQIQLAKQADGTALNHGNGLSRCWIVPAEYSLANVEGSLLAQRILEADRKIDERYRLAHVLLHPDVRRMFGMIIIDTPPRMTLGTVNALFASHAYVVPTQFDRVSTEAVGPYLRQVERLKMDRDIDLKFSGMVGMLTRTIALNATEQGYRESVDQETRVILRTDKSCVIGQHIPRRAAVNASDDLGYFLAGDNGPFKDEFYDTVFHELWENIVSEAD
jgi:cellulose biosynthesis protein BcsQ